MTKYKMRVETKVYFTVDVVADSEEEAKEKIIDGVRMDEYINDTWGVEIDDYDYIGNLEIESADEIWEDNISLDEVIEENIKDPFADDEDED